MPIKEIPVVMREQTPTEGYLLKLNETTYVQGAMLAPSQTPYAEVKLEDVPEEHRPGYVAPVEEVINP